MSISLLISSKYSSLESDRSKFQIYKNIKKEYEAFQAAESVTNMDLLDLCELEPVSVKDRRLFNLLFSPGAEESLDRDPIEVLDFEEVNAEYKLETPLTKSVKMKGNTSLVRKLLESEDIDPNKEDPSGKTPLSCAVECEDTSALQMILSHPSVDVNRKESSGRTPLLCAVECENIAAVELLLSHPDLDVNKLVDVGEKRRLGRFSPLYFAVLKGNSDIVGLLLQHKDIDVNHQPDTFYQYLLKEGKFTVLTKAIHLKNEAIVKLLLSLKDIDVNKTDVRGYTPLRQACNNGDGDEYHDMFSFFRTKEESSILNLILQQKDLKVKEGELSRCKRMALKNNLVFNREVAESQVTVVFYNILI